MLGWSSLILKRLNTPFCPTFLYLGKPRLIISLGAIALPPHIISQHIQLKVYGFFVTFHTPCTRILTCNTRLFFAWLTQETLKGKYLHTIFTNTCKKRQWQTEASHEKVVYTQKAHGVRTFLRLPLMSWNIYLYVYARDSYLDSHQYTTVVG